ncbi:MAG: nucleotidyltransferase family protein, partial [Myxococcota bacterium]
AHSPIAAAGDLPPFDSDEVLALSRRERVSPLLHVGFESGRIAEEFPEAFRLACEADYYRSLRTNIVALKSGGRILEDLRCAGIDMAPINGWSMVGGPLQFHTDPGARTLDLLEIIVRESQWRAAEAVLLDLGYRPHANGEDGKAAVRRRCFSSGEGEEGPGVALHWSWEGSESPAGRDGVSGDRFLDGLCDTTHSGYHRPTRFALLASAAFRAARRDPGRWMGLDDIHRLVSSMPMDWAALVTAARRWRVTAPVYAGLVTTREIFGTAIPRDVLERLAPGPVRRRLLHRSLATQWRARDAAQGTRAPHLLCAESWWELARAAAHSAASAAPRRLVQTLRGGSPSAAHH